MRPLLSSRAPGTLIAALARTRRLRTARLDVTQGGLAPMRTVLLAALLVAGSVTVLVPAASAHDEEQCHPAELRVQVCVYVPHCAAGLPVGLGCYPKLRRIVYEDIRKYLDDVVPSGLP